MMNMVIFIALALVAATSAYPTIDYLGEPHTRQFYYFNQPPSDHVIHRNYGYPPYNDYPGYNQDYRYGYPYGGPYDPNHYINKFGYRDPRYEYKQPYPWGYYDSSAPSELKLNEQFLPTNGELDLSGFKTHHDHHPNKDRVGLKPGHDSGLHGVSFGNDGYGQ